VKFKDTYQFIFF